MATALRPTPGAHSATPALVPVPACEPADRAGRFASALVERQVAAGRINPTPSQRAELERLIAGHERWQRSYEALIVEAAVESGQTAAALGEMGRVG